MSGDAVLGTAMQQFVYYRCSPADKVCNLGLGPGVFCCSEGPFEPFERGGTSSYNNHFFGLRMIHEAGPTRDIECERK